MYNFNLLGEMLEVGFILISIVLSVLLVRVSIKSVQKDKLPTSKMLYVKTRKGVK